MSHLVPPDMKEQHKREARAERIAQIIREKTGNSPAGKTLALIEKAFSDLIQCVGSGEGYIAE